MPTRMRRYDTLSAMTPDTVVPCIDLDAAVAEHAARGYRIELVVPADDPRVVVMSRDGAQVLLQRDGAPLPSFELFGDPAMIPPLVATFTISRGGSSQDSVNVNVNVNAW